MVHSGKPVLVRTSNVFGVYRKSSPLLVTGVPFSFAVPERVNLMRPSGGVMIGSVPSPVAVKTPFFLTVQSMLTPLLPSSTVVPKSFGRGESTPVTLPFDLSDFPMSHSTPELVGQ